MSTPMLRMITLLLLGATLLASGSIPVAAQRTPARPGEKSEAKPAPKPLPPGQPTTPENVHLPTEGEVKLGREVSAEVEKANKILTEGPYHERLQRVSAEVVQAVLRSEMAEEYLRIYKLPRGKDSSKRLPFEFSFKVVDDSKDVNAFALPGGSVYVTRGLLDEAVSDHELAGVLAHECVHVVFHHTVQKLKRAQKLQPAQIGGLLLAILAGASGSGEGAVGAAVMTQSLLTATISGYTQDLEREADLYAVKALRNTRFNPVGMMTFMQKLEVAERLRGNPDWGIYRTHPYTNVRVAAIEKELKGFGYRVDEGSQRIASGRFRLDVTPAKREGRDIAEILLNGAPFLTVAAKASDASPEARAQRIVVELGELLGTGTLSLNDLRRSPDNTEIFVRGVPVIRIYPEDATAAGSKIEEASERAYRGLARVLLQEQLDKRPR